MPLSVNARAAAAEKVIFSLIGFLLVPLIVAKAGVEKYGYWTLLLSITANYALLQGSISLSFDRFIAARAAARDHEGVCCIVGTSFYIMLALGAVIFSIVAIFARPIVDFFTESPLKLQYPWLLVQLTAVSVLQMLMQVFFAVPRGLQHYASLAKHLVGARVVYAAIIVIGLYSGYGLNALLSGLLGYCILALLSGMQLTSRFIGSLPLSFRYFSRDCLREIFGFGVRLQVSNIASWLSLHFDKLIIGKALTIEHVAYYEMATRLVYAIRQLPFLVFQVVVPRASELNEKGSFPALRSLYLSGTAAIAMFSALCIGALVLNADGLLSLWLRKAAPSLSAYTFVIILIGASVHICSGFGSSILRGANRPGPEMKANAIMAATNVMLSTVLLMLFGYRGVVVGTLAAFMVTPIPILDSANQYLEVKWEVLIRQALLPPFMIAIFAVGLNAWLIPQAIPSWVHGDSLAVLRIVLSSSIAIIITAVFVPLFGGPSLKKGVISLLVLLPKFNLKRVRWKK